MGLNINLFVHGVPMGQKLWGPKGDDQQYLSSFYGPKWDAPEVMKVDVMTFGGQTYAYYSFVKGQNVCDAQGRTGSYFALTLRINAFYSDVQNLYNILKATYEKMCVGLCVQDSGTMVKYLLSDFQNADTKLKDIEAHIVRYISEFSTNEDIVNLSSFVTSSQGTLSSVNLHECTRRVALDVVKKNGKLMVSPYFLSSSAAKTVASYKAEIEKVKQKAQQELQLQQQSSQERLHAVEQQKQEQIASVTRQSQEELRQCTERANRQVEQARQQVEQAKAENARKLSDLKQSYADVDEQLKQQKQKISTQNLTIRSLEKERQRYEKDQASLRSKIDSLQEQINQIKGLQEPKIGGKNPPKPLEPKRRRIKKEYVFCFIIVVVLLVILGLVWHFVAPKKPKTEHTTPTVEQTISNKAKHTSKEAKPKKQSAEAKHVEKVTESECKSSDKEVQYAIVVTQDGAPIKEVKTGPRFYTLCLKPNKAQELNGKWFVDDQPNNDGRVQAKTDMIGKTVKIEYVVGEKVIASKTFQINN